MYAFIRGKIVSVVPGVAIVDVGGVGYRVFIPVDYCGKLPKKGEEILFYTSFVVREQFQALYGFLSQQENELFEILINLSGIGPKTALAIIGRFSLPNLKQVVESKDVIALSKVPGIGKKTAQRLLIDLGVKLLDSPLPCIVKNSKAHDAISALTHLGYPQNRAESAVQKALSVFDEQADLSLLISQALKKV